MANENNTNNDGGNVGAGNDGGQNTNTGADSNAVSRSLKTDDVNAIAGTVTEILKGSILPELITSTIGSSFGEGSDFRKGLSSEITGAIKRMTTQSKENTGNSADAGSSDNSGQQSKNSQQATQSDIMNGQITLPGGKTMSVAALASAFVEQGESLKQREANDLKQQEQAKLLAIKTGMNAKNFDPRSIDLLAQGIAPTIVLDQQGNFIAKDVKVPNPLPSTEVPYLTQSMDLDKYLDMQARQNPHFVKHNASPGTGGGGEGGGSAGGDAEFTAEKALADPNLYAKWIEKDPQGCKVAMEKYQDTLYTKRDLK